MLANRKSKQWFEEEIVRLSPSFRDLEETLDGLFRSRWITRDMERAEAFLTLYKAIREKSQIPEFRDPYNGMNKKKISDIDSFVEQYKTSIYTFVALIPEVSNG